MCPGAYLAELELFNVWIRLFAKCIIEPALDEHGAPRLPNLDDLVNGGVVMPPKSSVMRIVKRSDSLI